MNKQNGKDSFTFLTPMLSGHELLVNKDERNCHGPVTGDDKQDLGLEHFAEQTGHHLDCGVLGFFLSCLSPTVVISLMQLLAYQNSYKCTPKRVVSAVNHTKSKIKTIPHPYSVH